MQVQDFAPRQSVKVIGANGQISIGKEYAGRSVLVEETEPGVWSVRTASVIPDNERWLHSPQAALDLQNALAWSQTHPPEAAAAATPDLHALMAQLEADALQKEERLVRAA